MTCIMDKCPAFFEHIEDLYGNYNYVQLRHVVLQLDKKIKWFHKQINDIAKIKYIYFTDFNDWYVNVPETATGLYKQRNIIQEGGLKNRKGARFTVTPNMNDISITSLQHRIIHENQNAIPLLRFEPAVKKIKENSPLDYQGAPVTTHICAKYIRRRELEEELMRVIRVSTPDEPNLSLLNEIIDPDDDYNDMYDAICTSRDILYNIIAKLI